MTNQGDTGKRNEGDARTVARQDAPSSGSTPIDGDGDGLPDGAWVAEQRKSANAAGVGLQFGLTICLFALLGMWADGKLDTKPWLMVAGVVLAFIGGTISMLRKFGGAGTL